MSLLIVLSPSVVFPEWEGAVSNWIKAVLDYLEGKAGYASLNAEDFQLLLLAMKVLPGFANTASELVIADICAAVSKLLDHNALIPVLSLALLAHEPKYAQF